MKRTLAQSILDFIRDEPKAKSHIITKAVSAGWLSSERNAKAAITTALERLLRSGDVSLTNLGRFRRAK